MKYEKQDPNDLVEKACDDIRRIVMLFHSKEYTYDDYFGNDISNDCCDIEQGYRKLKTALEIIINKEVNMSLVHHTTNAQHYNEIVAKHELYLQAGEFDKLRFRLLTQEEYELLKEVLTWKMNQ